MESRDPDQIHKIILKWEIAGVVLIFLAGSLLHFIYDWLGEWKPLALISAVNESTWEHLKMAFWAGLFFYTIEYAFLKRKLKNVVTAAAVALFITPAIIVLLFYSYTLLLGRHLVPVDIAIFFIAIAAAQYLHYKLITGELLPTRIERYAAVLLLMLLVAFSLFTYYPPEFFLFRDSSTGGYGIP